MRTLIRLTTVLFLMLALSSRSHAQAPFAEESPAKMDIREAVFRYMFEHYKYGPDVKFFCIEPERPLPESFLLRFASTQPHVVWISDCELTGGMNRVIQKKTGERGVRMTVLSLQSVSGQEATAHVEAFSDGIAASWNSLRIVFRANHWKVVKDTPEGVS